MELNRKSRCGTQWEIDRKHHRQVNLPGNASKETLRAWGHGAGQNRMKNLLMTTGLLTFTAPSNKVGFR